MSCRGRLRVVCSSSRSSTGRSAVIASLHARIVASATIAMPTYTAAAAATPTLTAASACYATALQQQQRRSYFVSFQPTPNALCYSFRVPAAMTPPLLPPGSATLCFDRANAHQSALARRLLEALPMVEEVTVGTHFVTVKRVDDDDAAAAAAYFALHASHDDDQDTRNNNNSDGDSDDTDGGKDSTTAAAAAAAAAAANADTLDEARLRTLITTMPWDELRLHVCALLTDHLYSGEPHVALDAPPPHVDTLPCEGDSEVVLMIKELIAQTIRPQLQDDGGDIRLVRYVAETGTMEVELLGACRTCKRSSTTLLDLVERTTRHWVPEVRAVREVRAAAAAAAAEGDSVDAHTMTAFERFVRTYRLDQQRDADASTTATAA